jgi:hypothetical protein
MIAIRHSRECESSGYMRSCFLCAWFVTVVALAADGGAGRTEEWPTATRGAPFVGARPDAAEICDAACVEFHPVSNDVPAPDRTTAPEEMQATRSTLRSQRNERDARTIQRAVMSALNGSSHESAHRIQAAVGETSLGGVARLPVGCFELKRLLAIPEGISLAGAGVTRTILFRPAPRPEGTPLSFIRVTGADARGQSRITGIAFVNVAYPGDAAPDMGIEIDGCHDFRVDNCYFEGFGSSAVRVTGDSRGVVDHCTFVGNYKPAIENLGYGVGVTNDNKWDEDMKLGTAEAVFVEDCTFVGCRHAVTSNAGAHYVFRYNLVMESVISHPVDAHGPGYGSSRGTRCVEIYANTIKDPRHGTDTGQAGDRPTDVAILVRGGGGVIFDNTFYNYLKPIELVLEFGAPPELRGAYPWQDQVHDLWIWNNRDERGTYVPQVNGYDRSREYILLNRDYFTRARPGYVPYTYPHPLTQQ